MINISFFLTDNRNDRFFRGTEKNRTTYRKAVNDQSRSKQPFARKRERKRKRIKEMKEKRKNAEERRKRERKKGEDQPSKCSLINVRELSLFEGEIAF